MITLGELYFSEGARGPLLAVCDGMGGQAGGEVASAMACQSMRETMLEYPATSDRAILARHLRSAVRKANQKICTAASADQALEGMGTTASVVAVVANTAVVAQVGDSRVYILRNEGLHQITRDQSVVSALIQAGQLSEERAAYSMQRGRILQALGASVDVEVSLSIAELRDGDRILICSDGLHEFVGHEPMTKACSLKEIAVAAKALTQLANEAGGSDNVSVVLAEITGGGLRPPVSGDALRFTELDPSLEGAMALSTTSAVGRRLAHQAGIRKDGWPLAIPATSQHPIVSGDDASGLAEQAYAEGSKTPRLVWAGIACGVLAAVFFALKWL